MNIDVKYRIGKKMKRMPHITRLIQKFAFE